MKVIHDNSVWGFISLVDGVHKGAPIKIGDIMKAESRNAAAKHSRGNIFDSEFHKSFSWTGPNYLYKKQKKALTWILKTCYIIG